MGGVGEECEEDVAVVFDFGEFGGEFEGVALVEPDIVEDFGGDGELIFLAGLAVEGRKALRPMAGASEESWSSLMPH